MLTIEHLRKIFKKKVILDGIDLVLESGVYGLLGINGAGKTTLIRCISGLYRPTAGAVRYEGENVCGSADFKRTLGYLPQSYSMFPDLTLEEMLDYFCAAKNIPQRVRTDEIDRVLNAVNLLAARQKRVRTLSGGMVRRAGIAQAMLGEPQVILLDEPTAGLDPEERARFKNTISGMDKNRLIIISTHIVEDIDATCDKIIVLHEGKLLFVGNCDDLRRKAWGKVFVVPEERWNNTEGNGGFVVRIYTDNGISRRVLGNNLPKELAVSPTLEDGYLSLIKCI